MDQGLGRVPHPDNSERYSPEELDAALSSIPGLTRCCIVPTPYSYGPLAEGAHKHESKFLQVGTNNIARLRFLATARAVLKIDIDELVSPTPEGSIFDTTCRSVFGYTRFTGKWRHAAPAAPLRHLHHIYEGEKVWQTKYCLQPNSIWGFQYWDVHRAVRRFMKPARSSPLYHYWHCKQISTNWKYNREPDLQDRSVDAELASLLNRVFAAN